MGSKCFRPIKQSNQPVYVSSLNKAMVDAEIVYRGKSVSRQRVIEQIVANEDQKGNLKRLFQHLSFHRGSVIDAIRECSRRVSFDKAFSSVVIGSVFCSLLVKMISTKKLKLIQQQMLQTNSKIPFQSKRALVMNSYGLRNLIYQLQSYFFELVIKVLVYSKQKKLYNSVSEILIQYTNACGDKIAAKKELRSILDLYLNVVFQKNIQFINKQSFLPFFAYSVLLSKSKSELFTSGFIVKHFNFILKIFFQLQDSKASSKSLIESQEFRLFEDSIQSIIKEFIVFSLQNKKTKQHILAEIMLQSDNEKFQKQKMVKLQKLIKQNLNGYNCEHFMMDWLGHMLRYTGKKADNQNESIRQQLMESLHEASIQATITSLRSLGNMSDVPTESKANAIQTLLRWFQTGLLDVERTLQLFSLKIFPSLLLNLYQQGGTSGEQEVIGSVKKLLTYILSHEPERIKEIFLLVNRQLRRNKNQFYRSQSRNLSFSRSSVAKSRQFPIIEDQAAQILWRKNIKFLSQQSTVLMKEFLFTQQEAEEIYAPVSKHTKTSINLVYLIELAAVGLRYIDLTKDQSTQQLIYDFLCSLTNSMKVPQNDIQSDYIYKLVEKLKLLSNQLIIKNDQLLCSFFKHCFKNLIKQNDQQVWLPILVTVIVVGMAIEKNKNKDKKRLQKLSWFLEDLFSIINKGDFQALNIYDLYSQNKSLFDFSMRISAKFQSIKLKTMQHLQKKAPIQSPSKNLSNIQNSAISSQFEVSSTNPDGQFVNVFKIVSQE